MTAQQLTAAFGSNVGLYDFTGCTVEGRTINTCFTSVAELEANHPYLIRTSADVSGFSLTEVDVIPEAEPIVNRDKRVRTYNSFIGNYVYGQVLDEPTYLFSTQRRRIQLLDGPDHHQGLRVLLQPRHRLG